MLNAAEKNFLATLSNDTWFGESWASYQHAQIAQFTALLTGRYMVLNANSGLTALFDQNGNETTAIPLFKQAILSSTIQKTTGQTPWVYYGDLPILLLCKLLIIICVIKKSKQYFNQKKNFPSKK